MSRCHSLPEKRVDHLTTRIVQHSRELASDTGESPASRTNDVPDAENTNTWIDEITERVDTPRHEELDINIADTRRTSGAHEQKSSASRGSDSRPCIVSSDEDIAGKQGNDTTLAA